MRAFLKEDKITHITESGDTEIGLLIPEVGLDRLRFNGTKVVDLADMDFIWVREIPGGGYDLHCVEVPNSQLVEMQYSQRKNLYTQLNGLIRVLTEEEISAKQVAELADQDDNRALKAELVELIDSLSFQKITDHIDTVFGGLNNAQRNSLKRVYKVVLYLAKKQRRLK